MGTEDRREERTPTKREVREGYDAITDRIGLSAKFYREVQKFAGRLSGTVVDIGCGRGFLLSHISAGNPNCLFLGMDISRNLVDHAKENNPSAHFIQADADRIPIRDSAVDAAFMTEVLEHMVDYKRTLAGICRVLKPGGRLVVTVPNRDWVKYDAYMRGKTSRYQPIDDHWFTRDELLGLFDQTGFDVVNIGGSESLYGVSGLPRLFEKIVLACFPGLRQRMKRLMVLAVKIRSGE